MAAILSSTSDGMMHAYLTQMRDSHRDMPTVPQGPLGILELRTLANYWRHRAFRSGLRFTLAGRSYPYHFARYNATWHNERAVEVPVAWEILRRFAAENVLEVGNVLPHYFRTRHTVVDKDEGAPNVVNADVLEFTTDRRFDLILSISTLEHVGWDYSEQVEERKILDAINHLRGLLAPAGRMVVTLPIGYNPHVDELLRMGEMPFDRMLLMKRVSRDNQWKETQWRDIESLRYGTPFVGANGLVIGVIGRDGRFDVPGLGSEERERTSARVHAVG